MKKEKLKNNKFKDECEWNMNNKVKIFFSIFAIVLLIFIIIEIYNVYALLYSQEKASVALQLGKWNIEVNNTNVTNGESKTYLIDTINLINSENVKEGKIAPGTKGNFEITMDPTDTQVSFRFDITINSEESNSVLTIQTITADNDINIVRTGENTYSGIIPLSFIETGKKVNFYVEFEWVNNEDLNERDTNVGAVSSNTQGIPMIIEFSQYLGETLEEYKGQ